MQPFFPVCPVCGKALRQEGRTLRCEEGHSFDFAKEGYVNLLAGRHKSGDAVGDSREMARARRAFLERGWFRPLADALGEALRALGKENPRVLDICCGEGYYSEQIKKALPCRLLGFDLSKEMVRLAAKRRLDALFFVANLAAIPLPDKSVDVALHLFAPFNEESFSRVLAPDGVLFSVVPGKRHLFELKEAVYDAPYENDEQLPQTAALTLTGTGKVTSHIRLETPEEIRTLFAMTPYAHRTGREGLERLQKLETLDMTIEFVLGTYAKEPIVRCS